MSDIDEKIILVNTIVYAITQAELIERYSLESTKVSRFFHGKASLDFLDTASLSDFAFEYPSLDILMPIKTTFLFKKSSLDDDLFLINTIRDAIPNTSRPELLWERYRVLFNALIRRGQDYDPESGKISISERLLIEAKQTLFKIRDLPVVKQRYPQLLNIGVAVNLAGVQMLQDKHAGKITLESLSVVNYTDLQKELLPKCLSFSRDTESLLSSKEAVFLRTAYLYSTLSSLELCAEANERELAMQIFAHAVDLFGSKSIVPLFRLALLSSWKHNQAILEKWLFSFTRARNRLAA